MSKPYGEVNVELFQEIKQKILEEPRRLNMSTWACIREPGMSWGDLMPPCGTTACIAGWATFIDAEKRGLSKESVSINAVEAANLLGLTRENAGDVFVAICWPRSFRERYESADSPKASAEVAAEFIDYICGVEPSAKET